MKKVVNFGQTPDFYGTGNASNDFIAMPWIPGLDGTVTRMGIEVYGLTSPSARVILGIYNNIPFVPHTPICPAIDGFPTDLLGYTEMIVQDRVGMLIGEMKVPVSVTKGTKYYVCFLENGMLPEVELAYGRGTYFLMFSVEDKYWSMDPPWVILPDKLSEYHLNALSRRDGFSYNVRLEMLSG